MLRHTFTVERADERPDGTGMKALLRSVAGADADQRATELADIPRPDNGTITLLVTSPAGRAFFRPGQLIEQTFDVVREPPAQAGAPV